MSVRDSEVASSELQILTFARAGKALHARCKDFKYVDKEVKDLVLLTAALSGRIDRQLLVLRRTCSSLPETYQDLQEQMLDRLRSKIEELMSTVGKFQTITQFQRCVVTRTRVKERSSACWVQWLSATRRAGPAGAVKR